MKIQPTARLSGPERDFYFTGYLLAIPDGDSLACLEYEPVRIPLPGGSYTPDFRIVTERGRTMFIEVKASYINRRSGKRVIVGKNYRDSRSKVRAAAALYPEYEFYMAIKDSYGGWSIERVEEVEWKKENQKLKSLVKELGS